MGMTSIGQIEKLDIHAFTVDKGNVLVSKIPSSVIYVDVRSECYSGEPFLNKPA